MGKIINVMLADDSAVIRKLLTEILNENIQINVVKALRNGAEAVDQFEKINPDVVILDVEMPVMDGLEAATRINQLDSNIPIIMFSSITTSCANATFTALENGACDYETKPARVGNFDEAKNHIKYQLIPKIINWGNKRKSGHSLAPKTATQTAPKPVSGKGIERRVSPVNIVTVGVSTGGPTALEIFLKKFPADFPVPMVIVQHMPPVFTQILAKRLDQQSSLSVVEAQEMTVVKPGKVVIAPGDYHMTIERNGTDAVTRLNQDEPVNFCRPAVDVLFQSVVENYGMGTLGVILTGMGRDGLTGCEQIVRSRGLVMAQDETSSAVWGMPGAVIQANLANVIGTPDEIAESVLRLTQSDRAVRI